ncbi:MAG: response regulator, partial [Chthoniobacteraceae bacterium]
MILLVDDDPVARRMLGNALAHLRFDVRTAADGTEALSLINCGPVPDLILMDFEMPGLDGLDVCQRIRTSGNSAVREVPVIMLTAHGDEADEIRCLTAGASDFVTKPASRAVLEARIRTQLRLRALNEEMRSRNQELARWRRDHEADLISARATQQGLLPSAPPAIPGWRVETH